MPKIESEKIDCLHRPCSRPAPRGKIESVRTHSEVIEQLIRFRCSNSCFLLETGIAGHEKLFLAKWHPKPRKKLLKRRFFDTAGRHEKLYGRSRLYASAQGRHETGSVLSLFSSLSFDISLKNSVQRWSSDFQGLFRVKIRKMALGSNDLSMLPLRPAGSDPEVVCQKNSFLKVSVSLGGFGPSLAHGKHSVRRRGVQATKNKAETCSLLDAIGRHSCGRWRDWI